MADIIYTLGTGVYVNITNKCPCNCAFCIRSKKDAIGSASNLWFDTEPIFDDIKREIEGFDFANCHLSYLLFINKHTEYPAC